MTAGFFERHYVCQPQRLGLFRTAGQVSDYNGAAALLAELPEAQWMLGDHGYDEEWCRDALQAKGITPCTPV